MAVYLDYNATTPIKPAVRAVMAEALALTGNPSSVHSFGREAKARLEIARRQVASAIGADPEDVIFTSGATEANNAALRHTGIRQVLTSAIEHDAVLAANPEAVRLPVDADGVLDLEAARAIIEELEAPFLVSLMLVNNETGVIQPVAELAALVHERGGFLHCDAAQALGKVAFTVGGLGADMLSLSGHKCGGPTGVGALVVSDRLTPAKWQFGGGQEQRRRPGTDTLPGIIGFGHAAELAVAELDSFALLAELRDGFEAEALAAVPAARVIGQAAQRAANTSSIALSGAPAQTQVMKLDLAGFAVSSGSACSSGRVEPSHVIEAVTGDTELASCTVRVSLGWNTQAVEVQAFTAAWIRMAGRMAAGSDAA